MTQRYAVTITRTTSYSVLVKASSEQEAHEKGLEVFGEANEEPDWHEDEVTNVELDPSFQPGDDA